MFSFSYLMMILFFLRIFGYEGEEAQNVIYVNWLSLLWNGAAKATEMYQPANKTWLQVCKNSILHIFCYFHV